MSRFSKLLPLIFIHHQIFCVFGKDLKIVGGENCDYDFYPYAVLIFSPDACGGTIITLKWILTAAQCINVTKISAGSVTVRTGFNRDEKFVQRRSVIKGILHEWYQDDERYDIGLMLADRPFNKTAYLKPAKLPQYVGFETKCKTVTAIGITQEKILDPNKKGQKNIKQNEPLVCMEMPIISRSECPGTDDLYIDEATICTKLPEGGKNACSGDSGAPVICKGVVIGISKEGIGCKQPGTPYYSTNVEYFWEFITKHTHIKTPPTTTTNKPTLGPAREQKYNDSNKCLPGKFFLIIAIFIEFGNW